MKRFILILLLTTGVSLGLWPGCGEKKETEVTSKDVKKEAKEAVETAKAYTQQQKKEYQEQIEAKIKGYDQNLDEHRFSQSAYDITFFPESVSQIALK